MFPGMKPGPGLQDSEGTDPFVAAALFSPVQHGSNRSRLRRIYGNVLFSKRCGHRTGALSTRRRNPRDLLNAAQPSADRRSNDHETGSFALLPP
jgi:hypothetical protein